MIFYLGTHHPNWIWRATVPLFVSHRRLCRVKKLHPATCRVAIDSGGFTEIRDHGKWTVGPQDYVEAVIRYNADLGGIDFAAPQDWMCEPFMVERTGLSVREHQERTVENYLELRRLAPGLPFIPVLQGWVLNDYLYCAALYAHAGVDLTRAPRVGLGSVCRRQSTDEIGDIVRELHGLGLSLHGFGVKISGLEKYGRFLGSSDSMAWSFSARRRPPMPGCTGHKNCANCMRFALDWRSRVVAINSTSSHAAA